MLAGLAAPILLSPLFDGIVLDVLGWIVLTLLSAAIVLVGVLWLPRGNRPWIAIVPGTIVFAVSVRLLALGSAIYFGTRMDKADDLYGAFGIAIAIQLWLYIIARAYVASQFINATFGGVSSGRIQGSFGAVLSEETTSAEDETNEGDRRESNPRPPGPQPGALTD